MPSAPPTSGAQRDTASFFFGPIYRNYVGPAKSGQVAVGGTAGHRDGVTLLAGGDAGAGRSGPAGAAQRAMPTEKPHIYQ